MTENGTETMGLETGGRRAVPMNINEVRSQLERLAEKWRRTDEERDKDVRSVNHEADQNELNSTLSLRHSKHETVEAEKKPMMAHDDEKNQDEICGNRENEEDEFNSIHQKILDTIETMASDYRKFEEERKIMNASMIETIKNHVNAWKLQNIHATKKVKKKSKSPNKNHTRNLSRRRTQHQLQKKIRLNNNPKKSKTRSKRTPKLTLKENYFATKKSQKSSKSTNKHRIRNLFRRRTRRQDQKRIRAKNNQTKTKTRSKRTIASQYDMTNSLSQIQKKKKLTTKINEQRIKKNRRFEYICAKWWFRWWSRWKFRWRLLWWTYRIREKQLFGKIWISINSPFRSQKTVICRCHKSGIPNQILSMHFKKLSTQICIKQNPLLKFFIKSCISACTHPLALHNYIQIPTKKTSPYPPTGETPLNRTTYIPPVPLAPKAPPWL